MTIKDGGLAQLGERLPCKQEVTSSTLVFSTDWWESVKCYTLHLKNYVLSVACRHAIKQNIFRQTDASIRCKKIFVLQCTLKTAYKKYLNDNCSADHLDYDQRSSSRCGWAPNTDFIKCLNTSKLVQTHDSSVLGWTVNQIKTSEVNVIYRHLTEIRENE